MTDNQNGIFPEYVEIVLILMSFEELIEIEANIEKI